MKIKPFSLEYKILVYLFKIKKFSGSSATVGYKDIIDAVKGNKSQVVKAVTYLVNSHRGFVLVSYNNRASLSSKDEYGAVFEISDKGADEVSNAINEVVSHSKSLIESGLFADDAKVLSHDASAKIYGNAKVSDNAKILSGNAKVSKIQ